MQLSRSSSYTRKVTAFTGKALEKDDLCYRLLPHFKRFSKRIKKRTKTNVDVVINKGNSVSLR